MLTKQCGKCGLVKPGDSFAKGKRPGKLRSYCTECHTIYCRRWREKQKKDNLVAYRSAERRANLARYRITPEDYSKLLVEQHYSCAICDGPPNGKGNRLHIDHDHETNEIRGLLCHSCNTGLGLFKDDPSLLQRATAYLAGTLTEVPANNVVAIVH